MPELGEVDVDGAAADSGGCVLRSPDGGDATAEDEVLGDSPLE